MLSLVVKLLYRVAVCPRQNSQLVGQDLWKSEDDWQLDLFVPNQVVHQLL